MTITLDNGMKVGSLEWPAICPVCHHAHTVTFTDDSQVPDPLPHTITALCGEPDCALELHYDSLARTAGLSQ